MPPFEAALVDRLRPGLGDWRDQITLDAAAMINPIFRSELYLDRGVDPNLTDFTVPAVHESASIAGLASEQADTKTEKSDSTADDAEDTVALIAWRDYPAVFLPPDEIDNWLQICRATAIANPCLGHAVMSWLRATNLLQRRSQLATSFGRQVGPASFSPG